MKYVSCMLGLQFFKNEILGRRKSFHRKFSLIVFLLSSYPWGFRVFRDVNRRRAAISFLVWKFEEICEGFGLNLEFERLDEVGGLRERGALTSESCRLREIRKAFEKLRDAYDELQETWLSETLEQEFAEETMDLLDDENVTDVETFVRDKAMDLVSPRLSLPTVADVLRLDTHDKTRAFAEYLAEYDETREE